MTTPYNSALRVQRRAVDEIRVAIRAADDALSSIATDRRALDVRLASEAVVAAGDWLFSSPAYGMRLRSQRMDLDIDRQRVDDRLGQLRGVALEASGRLHAVKTAADDYRVAEQRSQRGAEQAEADDFSGTRHARRQHTRPITTSSWTAA